MKFPNLPAATALTGAEVVPVTQGGADARTTTQDIANANESRATAIASAATTDIGAATAPFVHVTGTTTITALGTVQAGTRRIVVFDGILTLTHNGTSLILPTAANITTAAGDAATFVSEGSGNWKCVNYARADGTSLSGGAGAVSSVNGATGAVIIAQPIVIACSDETTALTTGVAKVTFRMPYAMTLTGVKASVTTAPTGAVLTVDINEGGTTILSTKLTIDATEKTSTTAATPAVISDSALAADAEITIDIDTVGSTIAGAGLKVTLLGYYA
jgi:archaellum component FlaF (FlaF/FlaG flagellin family)